jgi:hypothetical protein
MDDQRAWCRDVNLIEIEIIALLSAAFSATNLFYPAWTRRRATLRLLFDAAGAALFCWLMKANILVGIAAASLAPEKALAFVQTTNGWMSLLFPWAIAVGPILLAVDVYRIVRLKPASGSPVL